MYIREIEVRGIEVLKNYRTEKKKKILEMGKKQTYPSKEKQTQRKQRPGRQQLLIFMEWRQNIHTE